MNDEDDTLVHFVMSSYPPYRDAILWDYCRIKTHIEQFNMEEYGWNTLSILDKLLYFYQQKLECANVREFSCLDINEDAKSIFTYHMCYLNLILKLLSLY